MKHLLLSAQVESGCSSELFFEHLQVLLIHKEVKKNAIYSELKVFCMLGEFCNTASNKSKRQENVRL